MEERLGGSRNHRGDEAGRRRALSIRDTMAKVIEGFGDLNVKARRSGGGRDQAGGSMRHDWPGRRRNGSAPDYARHRGAARCDRRAARGRPRAHGPHRRLGRRARDDDRAGRSRPSGETRTHRPEPSARLRDEPLVRDSLADAADVLRRSRRRRLAVVDEDGSLAGLLCLRRDGRGFCTDEGIRARVAARTSRAEPSPTGSRAAG